MKKKLLIQVGIITSLFLAAVLIVVETVLYTSTQNIYLRAKNEMIERDIKFMNNDMVESSAALAGFIEYWQTHQEKMKAGFTEEEQDYMIDFWSRSDDEVEWYDTSKTEDFLDRIDPVYLHDLADMSYSYNTRSLQYKLVEYGYDKCYLLDIGEGADGTVLIAADPDDIQFDLIDYSLIGSKPLFDAKNTDAAEKLRSGNAGDIAYEVVKGSDGVSYYAGYILTAVKDEHRYALCVLYDWSDFRQKLNDSILPSVLISAALIVLANILLIRFLYVRSIRPVTKIQKNVREYTDTKDTERIVSELSKITAENEFGELAGDVSHLANEMERYTSEIARLAGEQERTAAELDLASRIQLSALPSVYPAFPEYGEFDIYATMTPAKEVGGDFYDFFLTDSDHLVLVIADVSGKGVPAALFMMMSKILLNDKAMIGGTPSEILAFVNDRICSRNEDNMFVTAWLGILEISTGKLTCANAGHEYPAVRRADGSFGLLKDKHSAAVGTMAGVKYRNYEIQLEPGDSVFVYTDGVPEATNSDDVLFGTDRMIEALNTNPGVEPEELLRTVKAAVDTFVGDAPQFDDLTMLTLRYFGKDGKR